MWWWDGHVLVRKSYRLVEGDVCVDQVSLFPLVAIARPSSW